MREARPVVPCCVLLVRCGPASGLALFRSGPGPEASQGVMGAMSGLRRGWTLHRASLLCGAYLVEDRRSGRPAPQGEVTPHGWLRPILCPAFLPL